MKRFYVSLLSVLMAITTFAQIKVIGKVTDQSTNGTLNDCIIMVNGVDAPFFTYGNGDFVLTLPQGGEYTVNITKTGYETFTKTINVFNESSLSVALLPAGTTNAKFAKISMTDEVIVSATRAGDDVPTTFTTIDKGELAKENLGQDLSYLLEQTPSVVVSSDGGSGVGYTSMRIRGTDMSRINFTINGIPYNDPESQGVFLVNIPDLSSSIEDIQIQRGVGTSTNGAGAFGASVNINTNKLNKKPYAEFNNSIGSFTTHKHTLKFGTGLIGQHFTFDGRLSSINTDGYLDRASVDLKSYYASVGFYDKNTVMRFVHFSGKEVTYQAWNGTDKATLESDRTYNSAGTDWGAKDPAYENEVDNYKQDHYQLHLSQGFATNWNANVCLFYIKGQGYFEQYKGEDDLADYNLDKVIVGTDTVSSTDLIRRRWLDNDFYGATYAINYEKSNKGAFTLGGAWNQYDGDHFGEIIWARYASNGDLNHRYYGNNGLKTDFNVFAKGSYYIGSKVMAYGDLQYRRVSYSVAGIDNDQRYLYNDVDYDFFNPKIGLTYFINKHSNAYASFAIANREPTRNDMIDAITGTEPEHENLKDLEIGYRMSKKNTRFSTNFYYMAYKNQLVLTGALNDVGSAVRTNVDKSFRTGIETSLGFDLGEIISLDGNVTWSVNEIKEYDEIDYLGNTITHDNTKISYSPQWVGSLTAAVRPIKGLELAFINKFVGDQFLDNTTNETTRLDKYTLSDVRLSYTTKTKLLREIKFTVLVNNFTNRKYESNGYVYYGEPYYFPQAGANFMTGLNLKF